MVLVAWIEAFCGKGRSTRSSGRSEDGKNWLGIRGTAKIEATNSANARGIVSHLAHIAPVSRRRYSLRRNPSFVSVDFGGFRMRTPSSGAKRTATNQDTTSAIATTANSEKVYSPAELAAKPTGTNPAMVRSEEHTSELQ